MSSGFDVNSLRCDCERSTAEPTNETSFTVILYPRDFSTALEMTNLVTPYPVLPLAGNRQPVVHRSKETVITTDRLELRPFRHKDLDLFAQFFANAEFMQFSSGPLSRERTAEFIEKVMGWDRAGLPSQYVVEIRESGTPIGYCGFFHQQVDDLPEIEIGYRLHPDSWGNGFATEAARAVRDHGFSKLNLERVISLIHPDNIASRRVAEKNGMTQERATTFKGFPTQVFAISRSRWLKLGGA